MSELPGGDDDTASEDGAAAEQQEPAEELAPEETTPQAAAPSSPAVDAPSEDRKEKGKKGKAKAAKGKKAKKGKRPRIDGTVFGSITVEGTVFDHDVIIAPSGRVRKRRKKLSKQVYGTSHTISLDEAKYVYKEGAGADRLIVGGGQNGTVKLSPEAADYFARKKCEVVLRPTPDVIAVWNESEGRAVGLFHVTC